MNEEIDKTHDKIWYIKRSDGEKIYGPFAAARVRNYLLEGKIDLRDQVSKNKKDWRYLMQQPEVVPMQMRDPEKFADTVYTDDLDPGKKGSLWLPILLVIIFVGGGIAAAMLFKPESEVVQTDCSAAPAANINWNSCNKRGLRAENVNLDGLSATNIKMEEAILSGSSLKAANLRYAKLDKSILDYVDFSEAVLKGASLRGADLSNAILKGSDLRYVDLSEARLGGVQIKAARLDGAIWNNGNTCKPGSTGKCIQ
jgi:hypothetical protein